VRAFGCEFFLPLIGPAALRPRISKASQLRIKDIDLNQRKIFVSGGKGMPLPEAI